jgi:hypothetical protein
MNRPKRKAVEIGRDLYAQTQLVKGELITTIDSGRGHKQPNVEKGKNNPKLSCACEVWDQHLRSTFTWVKGSGLVTEVFIAKGTRPAPHFYSNVFNNTSNSATGLNGKKARNCVFVEGVTKYSGYEGLANQLLIDNPGVAPEDWDFTSVAKINERAAVVIAALLPPEPSTPAAAAVIGVSAASAIELDASPAAALTAAAAQDDASAGAPPVVSPTAAPPAAAPHAAAPPAVPPAAALAAAPAAAPPAPGPQAPAPTEAAAAAAPKPSAGINQRLEALEVRFAGRAQAQDAPLPVRLSDLEGRVGVPQPLAGAKVPHRLAALEAELGFGGGLGEANLLQRLEALEVAVDAVDGAAKRGPLLARVVALEAGWVEVGQGDVSARLAALEHIFLE